MMKSNELIIGPNIKFKPKDLIPFYDGVPVRFKTGIFSYKLTKFAETLQFRRIGGSVRLFTIFKPIFMLKEVPTDKEIINVYKSPFIEDNIQIFPVRYQGKYYLLFKGKVEDIVKPQEFDYKFAIQTLSNLEIFAKEIFFNKFDPDVRLEFFQNLAKVYDELTDDDHKADLIIKLMQAIRHIISLNPRRINRDIFDQDKKELEDGNFYTNWYIGSISQYASLSQVITYAVFHVHGAQMSMDATGQNIFLLAKEEANTIIENIGQNLDQKDLYFRLKKFGLTKTLRDFYKLWKSLNQKRDFEKALNLIEAFRMILTKRQLDLLAQQYDFENQKDQFNEFIEKIIKRIIFLNSLNVSRIHKTSKRIEISHVLETPGFRLKRLINQLLPQGIRFDKSYSRLNFYINKTRKKESLVASFISFGSHDTSSLVKDFILFTNILGVKKTELKKIAKYMKVFLIQEIDQLDLVLNTKIIIREKFLAEYCYLRKFDKKILLELAKLVMVNEKFALIEYESLYHFQLDVQELIYEQKQVPFYISDSKKITRSGLARNRKIALAQQNFYFSIYENYEKQKEIDIDRLLTLNTFFIKGVVFELNYMFASMLKNENNDIVQVAFSSEIGPRPNLEDTHLFTSRKIKDKQVNYFAIFDGHGAWGVGDITARMAIHSNYGLQNAVFAYLENVDLADELQVVKALDMAIKMFDVRVCSSMSDQGATAIISVLIDDNLYTLNLGDARAILVKKSGKTVRLSYDHKPNAIEEQKRIKELGGEITRSVWHNSWLVAGCAIARGFGDRDKKRAYKDQFISSVPFITLNKFSSGDQLLLACDGLWDVCSDKRAGDIIRLASDKNIQEKVFALVAYAYDNKSQDNVSVMLVKKF